MSATMPYPTARFGMSEAPAAPSDAPPGTPVTLAWFGKLPSRGDFVRSAGQGALTQQLDRWLSQGLELVAQDPRWKQRYDQVAPCPFAFLAVRGGVALAGHLAPSTDASGRRFPFVATGAFEVTAPLSSMALAPLALAELWNWLAAFCREACTAQDAAAALARADEARLEIPADLKGPAASLDAFLDLHTVGSLEAALRAAHPSLDLRRTLLALGLLLQPVPASGVSRLDTGLALPLPDDPLLAAPVAALWMSLVSGFVARGDFELALFVVPRGTAGESGSTLCLGFAGGSPATLHAVFDTSQRATHFVDVVASDWVEDHAGGDYAIKKLGSYLRQPQLSLRQAVATFRECFLGE